jgi:hypothetical protein
MGDYIGLRMRGVVDGPGIRNIWFRALMTKDAWSWRNEINLNLEKRVYDALYVFASDSRADFIPRGALC